MSLTYWCWLSREPVSQATEALPITPDADTMMLWPPALPVLPSGGYTVSDWCSCTLADTPSAQDCSAEVEIAAIWSNSPSNFDMYEDDSYSSSSPQDPGTLFEASLYQPTGILLHLSTCAGTRVWCGPCSTEGSLKGGRDFLSSSWCTIFMSRICS